VPYLDNLSRWSARVNKGHSKIEKEQSVEGSDDDLKTREGPNIRYTPSGDYFWALRRSTPVGSQAALISVLDDIQQEILQAVDGDIPDIPVSPLVDPKLKLARNRWRYTKRPLNRENLTIFQRQLQHNPYGK